MQIFLAVDRSQRPPRNTQSGLSTQATTYRWLEIHRRITRISPLVQKKGTEFMGAFELPQLIYGMPKPTQRLIDQKEIALLNEIVADQGLCWRIA